MENRYDIHMVRVTTRAVVLCVLSVMSLRRAVVGASTSETLDTNATTMVLGRLVVGDECIPTITSTQVSLRKNIYFEFKNTIIIYILNK